ncbi:MAG: hypothetical protein K8I02_06435, partial [Candidatus Methylomirabilis sp.]|nr:hypothetical protein [Deltaproteobacteria bacterium]
LATDALRVELSPWGIDVVLVIPGTVETPTFDLAREDTKHLREDPENPYRGFMDGMERLAEAELKRAPKASVLGEVIAEAATTPRPKARYFAPLAALLTARAATVIPARLIDKALLALVKP